LSAVKSLTAPPSSVAGSENSGIVIYPNPSRHIFHISLKDSGHTFTWKVTNTHGSLVLTSNEPNDPVIDMTNHPRGIYYLTIDHGGLLAVRKLVLQ